MKISGGYRADGFSLARVAKVWKNGVVETVGLDGHSRMTYNPNGRERGAHGFRYSCICPLADGETAESILAEQKAKADAARVKAERGAAEHAAAVAAWWKGSGRAIWDARITLSEPFLGETIHIIRFERYGEWYMPFVILGKRDRFGGQVLIEAQTGGLHGAQYKSGVDGEDRKSISTYGGSDHSAATLEEVLYSICH